MAALGRQGRGVGIRLHRGDRSRRRTARRVDSRYPYTDRGDWPAGRFGDFCDQLTVLAYLAGRTGSARLLTSVMVAPHRPPVLAAKMLSTIDVLSHGRLTPSASAPAGARRSSRRSERLLMASAARSPTSTSACSRSSGGAEDPGIPWRLRGLRRHRVPPASRAAAGSAGLGRGREQARPAPRRPARRRLASHRAQSELPLSTPASDTRRPSKIWRVSPRGRDGASTTSSALSSSCGGDRNPAIPCRRWGRTVRRPTATAA